MNVCAICASPVPNGDMLCAAHPLVHDQDWAVANRLMCDFIHRGKVPPRGVTQPWEEELREARLCELAIL